MNGMDLVPLVVGAIMIVAAFHFAGRFYPPGEGYAEEKRNGRIALALAIAGIASILTTFILSR